MDLLLEKELLSAMPRDFADLLDLIGLSGIISAEVKVDKKPSQEQPSADLTVTLGGKCDMCYSRFRYPLQRGFGEDSLRRRPRGNPGTDQRRERYDARQRHRLRRAAEQPNAGCGHARSPTSDVPIDDKIPAALDKDSAQIIRNLHLGGTATRMVTDLKQSDGKPLDFNVVATLKDVTLKPDAFPYAVSGTSGVVTIRPDRVILNNLRGRHGKAELGVSGEVLYTAGTAFRLDIDGTDVSLDDDLFMPLPPAAQKTWRQLSPSGVADMKVAVADNMPDCPGRVDYKIALTAKDMAITYEKFPLRFKNVRGKAYATPGKIVLDGLTAQSDKARAGVSGTIISDETMDLAQAGRDGIEHAHRRRHAPRPAG